MVYTITVLSPRVFGWWRHVVPPSSSKCPAFICPLYSLTAKLPIYDPSPLTLFRIKFAHIVYAPPKKTLLQPPSGRNLLCIQNTHSIVNGLWHIPWPTNSINAKILSSILYNLHSGAFTKLGFVWNLWQRQVIITAFASCQIPSAPFILWGRLG